MPLVSVITPASRGVKVLATLINDFKNQTWKDFEHVIVWDGEVPKDVRVFIREHEKDYNIKFLSIPKDMGDMRIAPGTRPRNYGIKQARGKFVCFCDDDDRYRDDYLEAFINNMDEKSVSVLQMSCQKSRMYRDGAKDEIILIPEVDLPYFPIICHVGTPCFMVPLKWAQESPWEHEPEHDFRFIRRIMEKYKPAVRMNAGMRVDVDGLVIKGMKDWVTKPPFYRD